MTQYVDSSALAKRYVAEPESDRADAILLADPAWITGQHAYVEVRLALQRRLDDAEREQALDAFEHDWRRTYVVEVDDALCRMAAELGAVTAARSLDALHLAAAERAGGRTIPVVTFDLRLARAARELGFVVVGT